MKLNRLFIIIIFLFPLKNYAQEITSDGKQNLSGKWKGSCPTAFENKATIRNCPICPFVISEENPQLATLKDIDLTFTPDSIYISAYKDSGIVAYHMNTDNHSIRFHYGKYDYNFRVFYANQRVILEDADGLLVELERQP
jgi:hypothetical protein